MENRCDKCAHYRRLKHNFKTEQGYEESHCCVLWVNEKDAWIQEVAPEDQCEVFKPNEDTLEKIRAKKERELRWTRRADEENRVARMNGWIG